MPHGFSYMELHTQDTGATKAFYRTLFDWKMDDNDFGGQTYTSIQPPEGPAAGLTRSLIGAGVNQWVPYVLVQDVVAATAKARALGATILREKTEVPGTGFFAYVKDPSGAPFALWEKSAKA